MLDDLEVGPNKWHSWPCMAWPKSSYQESQQHFKPAKKHLAGGTEARSRKAPVSALIFMLTTVPFLVVEVFLARGLFGDGWGGFCLTSLLISLQ